MADFATFITLSVRRAINRRLMSESIWVSHAPGDFKNFRPFSHDVYERDPEPFPILTKKLKNGEPLDDAEFPTAIWYTKAKCLGLPHFFIAYGYWIVSAAAAKAIKSCGLGGGELRRVPITRKDQKTPIDGEWYCWSIGNVRPTLNIGQSTGLWERNTNKWCLPTVMKDNLVAVDRRSIEGPPAWVDPLLQGCFFMSGRLQTALKKAGASRGFMLDRCRLVDGIAETGDGQAAD